MTENNPDCTSEVMMRWALEQAEQAARRDEVPIGAILQDNKTGDVLAIAGNQTIEMNDPTAHAEILCIRRACKEAESQRIPNTTLYVTLEPCTMCAAAIAFARIDKIVIGALDPKGGGIVHGAKFFDQPTCHHKIEIEHGILKDECSAILKNFFKDKRKN